MNPGFIVKLLYLRLGYYGNWGGEGWSAGSFDPNKFDTNVRAKDPLDEAFKTHDIAYNDAELAYKRGEIDKDAYYDQRYQADKQLLEDMKAVDTHYYPDPADNEKMKDMRDRAAAYFEAKTWVHDHMDRDPALFPDPMIPDDLWNDLTKNTTINTSYTGSRTAVPRRDPLALDLDGDGLETTGIDPNNPTLFDHNGDGVRTGTGWLKGDDAFLALDRNGNGTIDNGGELFGVDTTLSNGQKAANGFAALADLDSNHDGLFSALDAQYANVKIWRDLNQDGLSQSNELTSLSAAGIASISLANTATNVALAGGNVQTAAGSYTKTDGHTGTVGTFSVANLNLAQNGFYSDFTDHIPLTDAARTLPGMKGAGMVRDLQEAASLNAALVGEVASFASMTRSQMMSGIDHLLADWANTSTMKTSIADAGSRGYTLAYLPPGMSQADYFTLHPTGMSSGSGGSGSGGSTIISSPTERARLDALLAKAIYYENLISVLERFNGLPFVTVADDKVTTGQGQMVAIMTPPVTGPAGATGISAPKFAFVAVNTAQTPLLDQSYAQLKDSVYGGLVMETRLKPYLDDITLTIDDSGIRLDFSAMNSALDTLYAMDKVRAFSDCLELNIYGGGSLNGSGWSSAGKLVGWANAASASGQLETLRSGLATAFATGNRGTPDIKVGTSGSDTLSSGSGDDVLVGNGGNDTLYGNAGNDVLDGGAGNDFLSGGTGADTYLFGRGSGQDAVYNSDGDALGTNPDSILLGAGIATSEVTLTRSGDDLLVAINGTTDSLRVSNYFYQDGTLSYAVENLRFADGTTWDIASVKSKVMIGTSGNDNLYGYAGNDTLSGGDGNDILTGNAGDDALDGGNGNDNLSGGEGNDNLNGAAGADNLYGGNGNDLLNGGDGNDTLYGDAGNDVLQGSAGDDYLYDAAGTALFDGGAGNDTITGGSAAEIYLGGLGNDTYTTGPGNDVVLFNKGDGHDTFAAGGSGSDTLSLGGGIAYADLSFSKVSNDLVLKIGASDEIDFKDWYAASPSKPVVNLQAIVEAMTGFNPGGADPLLDQKVETFSFSGLVGAFDAARSANPALTSWALSNALATCQIGGSDTAAIGGDLAYQYGKNGTLAGMGLAAAQSVISNSGFGSQAQALQSLSTLQSGAVRLS